MSNIKIFIDHSERYILKPAEQLLNTNADAGFVVASVLFTHFERCAVVLEPSLAGHGKSTNRIKHAIKEVFNIEEGDERFKAIVALRQSLSHEGNLFNPTIKTIQYKVGISDNHNTEPFFLDSSSVTVMNLRATITKFRNFHHHLLDNPSIFCATSSEIQALTAFCVYTEGIPSSATVGAPTVIAVTSGSPYPLIKYR